MNHSDAVRTHLNLLSIIASVIFGGVAVFTGLVWYLISTGALPPEDIELPVWMGTAVNAVALIILLKAHFLPRIFLHPGPDAGEEAVLAWHKKATIFGYAIREGAAFTALVGALLTGQIVGAIVVVGLTLVAMVLAWPRSEQLQP